MLKQALIEPFERSNENGRNIYRPEAGEQFLTQLWFTRIRMFFDMQRSALISASYHGENSATKFTSHVANDAKRVLKVLLIATIKRVINELKLRVQAAIFPKISDTGQVIARLFRKFR